MKFHFFIRCNTRWGEELFIQLHTPGGGIAQYAMQYLDEQFWQAEIELDTTVYTTPFRYGYLKKDAEGIFHHEGEKHHEIPAFPPSRRLIGIFDEWTGAGSPVHVFYTRPFSVLCPEKEKPASTREPAGFSHCFRVKAPQLGRHETVCITGNTEKMKNWDTVRPLLMQPENGWYTIRLKMPASSEKIFYKYGIYNTRTKQFVHFEEG
ncbi:MAG: hypothetical protein JNM68_08975, partial [Dinghuibacter sp.]|nr:hypothetical protein [Dinghuibacter sp.]